MAGRKIISSKGYGAGFVTDWMNESFDMVETVGDFWRVVTFCGGKRGGAADMPSISKFRQAGSQFIWVKPVPDEEVSNSDLGREVALQSLDNEGALGVSTGNLGLTLTGAPIRCAKRGN